MALFKGIQHFLNYSIGPILYSVWGTRQSFEYSEYSGTGKEKRKVCRGLKKSFHPVHSILSFFFFFFFPLPLVMDMYILRRYTTRLYIRTVAAHGIR